MDEEISARTDANTGQIIALTRIITLLLGSRPDWKHILQAVGQEDALPHYPAIRDGYTDLLQHLKDSLTHGVH